MSLKKYGLWLGYLIVGLYFAWYILATSSNRSIEALSRYIPGWLATLIWASWLILAPIAWGPFNIPKFVRVSLDILLLIAYLLLPVAVRFYPVDTVLIMGLLFIGTFWLIPWWKAKWNRRGGQPMSVSPNATILKIAVMADRRITIDGSPATIDSLRVSLNRLADQKGAVWYYREVGQTEAPPEPAEIMKAVIENRLPIRLSRRPDYSDAISPDGRPIAAGSRTQ